MAWMWLLVLVLIIVAIIVKIRRSARIFIIRQNSFDQPRHDYSGNSSQRQPLSSAASSPSGEVERMVCCEFCEVYVPVSEAVERSGKIFCCHEHSEAYFSRKHSS